MKVRTGILLAIACAGMVGCASIGPPEAPSLELPKPPTDLRAQRKGDKVTLTWTIPARTTERQSVKYLGKTEICRSLTGAMKECATALGNAAPPADFETERKSGKKLTASFADTLPVDAERAHPQDFAVYAVEVLNEAGRGAGISNQVRVPLAPVIPPFGGFVAEVTARGVLISWQCAGTNEGAPGVEYLFRIYRREDGSEDGKRSKTKIADVPATACVDGTHESVKKEREEIVDSFLDQGFEWEKSYSYRGTVVSVIEAAGRPRIEVEGDDTSEAKVFAHDVFPPAVPGGLQAVSSGVGQESFIDLIWSPVSDADLAGYNVYRREAREAPVKINSELTRTPTFRDAKVVAGKSYFYSVSAVDERGNESQRSGEAGESVPQ